MILQGGVEKQFYSVVVISLITSLMVLYSVMKIFINGFWGETILSEEEEKSTGRGILIPGSILAALIILLGIGADWAMVYVEQAVEVLVNPLYILTPFLLNLDRTDIEEGMPDGLSNFAEYDDCLHMDVFAQCVGRPRICHRLWFGLFADLCAQTLFQGPLLREADRGHCQIGSAVYC